MLDHTKLNDHRAREFSKSLRGYSTGEVDDFIETLLFEASQLVDALSSLNQQVSEMQQEKDELKKREENLSATLVAAQSTAEEWKTLAKRDADQIVREAHIKAEEILQRAHQESEELLRQAREKTRMEEEVRSRLRHDLSITVSRLKGELTSLREAMDRWEQNVSVLDDNAVGSN